MYKHASYKEKYAALQEWIPLIIETVKKDLKNEHLKKDFYFIKKYLASKNIHKISTEELAEAYRHAIANEENGESLAEFITSRWLLKNTELYDYFEKRLSQINSDFVALDVIDMSASHDILTGAKEQFGTPHTYLFAVLNSVVFPDEVFHQLKQQAQQEVQQKAEEANQMSEKLVQENMRERFEREMVRLTDKYEKKLAGLEKKYHADTESLKKQVAQLQRKLQGKSL